MQRKVPTGSSRADKLNGDLFHPAEALLEQEWKKICDWLKKHFDISLPVVPPAKLVGPVRARVAEIRGA